MNISDEATKVAQDAFLEVLTDLRLKEGGGFKVASQQRRAIAAALESAAPHLMAAAWDEGLEVGLVSAVRIDSAPDANPYRKPA